MNLTCPACGAAELEPLADLGAVPVLAAATFDDVQTALCSPVGRVTLASCPGCCLARNTSFDETLVPYDADYDNSLHHSATFQRYATSLARRLARGHDLRGKSVVELGAGKGHFLVELCRTAGAHGIGYDPSYDGQVRDRNVEFVTGYMPWNDPPIFDFFLLRHVLEHVPEPYNFLVRLRRACGTRPVEGYIEVPDAIYDFDRSPWNSPYPHVSYFSATALARLAIRAGFGLVRLVRSFEGQYLALELRVNGPTPDHVSYAGMGLHMERSILAGFRNQHASLVHYWREWLRSAGYKNCAVWGAGAKGLGFLTQVDPGGEVAAVIDQNPHKHGRYLPVTGHRVDPPESLRGRELSVVVITNPSYQAEVEASLVDLGVSAGVICAH